MRRVPGGARPRRDGEALRPEVPQRDVRVRAALGYPVPLFAAHVLLTARRREAFLRYHAVQSLALVAAGTVVFAAISLFFQAVLLMRVLALLLTPLALGGWIVCAVACAARTYRGEVFTISFLSPFLSRADLEG